MSNIFFVDHLTESAYSRIISKLCISQEYIQNFEKNWKNSVLIRVNNFAKSVEF